MRTQVQVSWPFGNQDIRWIDQAVCESYAGGVLKGKRTAEVVALSLGGGDYARADLLKKILDTHPNFIQLQKDLIDEYGIEYFIKPKTHLEHVRDIEERMEMTNDPLAYAKLSKELRELRGWTDKSPMLPNEFNDNRSVTTNNFNININDPVEVSRMYRSIMG